MLALADRNGLQPDIFADAVVDMDDQIAFAKRLQLCQKRVGIFLAFLPADQTVTSRSCSVISSSSSLAKPVSSGRTIAVGFATPPLGAASPSASCQLSAICTGVPASPMIEVIRLSEPAV